jgi:hypothetical protein
MNGHHPLSSTATSITPPTLRWNGECHNIGCAQSPRQQLNISSPPLCISLDPLVSISYCFFLFFNANLSILRPTTTIAAHYHPHPPRR